MNFCPQQINLHPDMFEELLYFDDSSYPDFSYEEHFKKPSIGLVLKRSSEDLQNVDDVILQMVYGNARKFPGDEKCPSRTLTKITDQGCAVIGLWAPPNGLAKAIALKLLFPNLSNPFKLPEVPFIPPHIAMAFDAFKARDIIQLSLKYPGEVMKMGFFTSDKVGEAQLIAKTLEEFENKTVPTTYEEKVVIQLSKLNLKCLEAFKELGPCYCSANAVVGKTECKYFFPDGYDVEAKTEKEIKKKGKKRKGKAHIAIEDDSVADTAPPESQIGSEADQLESEQNLLGEEESDEEHKVLEDDEYGNGTDKATSPMVNDEDRESKKDDEEK